MTKPDVELWYSCEVRRYSVVNDFGEHDHTTIRLVWSEYAVVRATRKGVWLRGFLTGEFFVLGNAIRQRAVPTKALALQDAQRKKERHIIGCEARLRAAQLDLELIEREIKYNEPR